MATFAIFYNMQDLTPLAAIAQDANLPSGLRSTGNRYWQAGLQGWSVAPLAVTNPSVPPSYYTLPNGDPDCRVLILSGSNQVTLAGFIQFLRDVVAANAALIFAGAIAADLQQTAISPWPPA